MAEIIPFRGIRYHARLNADIADLTTPPYDVISPERQEAFHQRHPHNIIRLILSRPAADDTQDENQYTRAGNLYDHWRRTGILVRDAAPRFYLNATGFEAGGHAYERHGLLAAVRLEPFENGVVLPHEKTFSRVKADRLRLMRECHANFSPIFSMFSDEENMTGRLAKWSAETPPIMEFTDMDGHRQRFWEITDTARCRRLQKVFTEKCIYIADGHHRYETALAFRDEVTEAAGGLPADHPVNFVLMHLTGMEDPGMMILPAHRLLRTVPEDAVSRFLGQAPDCFDVKEYPADTHGRAAFLEGMENGNAAGGPVIGAVLSRRKKLLRLSLKPGVMADRFGSELPAAVHRLDVSVMTRLILMDLMGFDAARLDNEEIIAYTTDPAGAVDRSLAGEFDAAFLLRPTPMSHVREVAAAGLVMPRKSTYFYPKVITGLVLHHLKPADSASRAGSSMRATSAE